METVGRGRARSPKPKAYHSLVVEHHILLGVVVLQRTQDKVCSIFVARLCRFFFSLASLRWLNHLLSDTAYDTPAKRSQRAVAD